METHTIHERFDALLRAMVPLSGRTKPSADPASGEADGACYDDTQTPPDTSEDASR